MSAIDTVIANAVALNAKTAAINADTRVVYLRSVAEANRLEVTQDGEAGFREVVDHFMSARGVRRQRAKTLYLARRAYLFNGCSMREALGLAADLRKQEKEA